MITIFLVILVHIHAVNIPTAVVWGVVVIESAETSLESNRKWSEYETKIRH